MGRTVLLGTFFDYYCRAHHGGATLDLPRAARLARAIAAASRSARPQVVSGLFRRVLADLAQAGVYLPRRLWSLLLSMVRDEQAQQAELVVEEDLDGFFSRATRLVERELAAAREITAQALCRAFDEAWAAAAEHPADADATAGHRAATATAGNESATPAGRGADTDTDIDIDNDNDNEGASR
jgi:hypothetical protein